jgi:hypothetical protein
VPHPHGAPPEDESAVEHARVDVRRLPSKTTRSIECSWVFLRRGGGRVREHTVDDGLRDPGASRGGEHVEVRALAGHDRGREERIACRRATSRGERLVGTCSRRSARRRPDSGLADLRVEQAQVVGDLGHRRDGRLVRRSARGALLERDRRRHAASRDRRRAEAGSAGTGARRASASPGSAAAPRRRSRRTRACSCPSRSGRSRRRAGRAGSSARRRRLCSRVLDRRCRAREAAAAPRGRFGRRRCPARRARKAAPVRVFRLRDRSGVPSATSVPPSAPPPGPSSMTQSAARTMSRS